MSGADRSKVSSADKRFDVFLSHPSIVKAQVLRIADGLRSLGLEPWVDVEQMAAGSSTDRSIAIGLADSKSCAVFVASSEPSGWVEAELSAAVGKAAVDPEFRVFLVLLRGVGKRFDHSRFPSLATSRVWVDLRWIDEAAAIEAVARGVRGEAPRTPLAVEDPIADLECPYVGYRPFDAADSRFFWGREGDVQKMIESLKSEPFLAVVGNSGSGKSSAVRAGLVPAIQDGQHLPDIEEVVIFTPESEPLTRLAGKLAALHPERSVTSILNDLLADQRTLGALSDDRICWVIDQMEEIFTQAGADSNTVAFVDNILRASRPGGGATVVLTMRSDFIGHTTSYEGLADRVAAHQYIVHELKETALRDVIEQPLKLVGIVPEPGLTERILADGAADPGMLPLLQHTLRELWQRSNGRMTHAAYDEIGGLQGSLADQTEVIFANFSPNQMTVARSMLTRMVALGEGTRDTKRPVDLAELQMLGSPGDVARVVDELSSARLLRVGERSVELTHDSLLETWPQLRTWVDNARSEIRTREALVRAAAEWQKALAAGDPVDGYLLIGHRLASAIDWRRSQTIVSDDVSSYLDASEAAERSVLRARDMRRRRVLAGMALTSVVLFAIAIFALGQWRTASQQRREAQALALTAESRALLESNPVLATVLAMEGAQWAGSPTAEQIDAIGSAVDGFFRSFMQPLPPLGSGPQEADGAVTSGDLGPDLGLVRAVAYSPDGSLLASCGDDGMLRLWEPERGDLLAELVGPVEGLWGVDFSPDSLSVVAAGRDGAVYLWDLSGGFDVSPTEFRSGGDVLDVAFSPSGRLIASGSSDGRIRLWNARSGELVDELGGHAEAVWAVAFSADDSVLASVSLDGTGRLWDVESGESTAVFDDHDNIVLGLAFSPDGSLVATSSFDRRINLIDVRTGRLLDTLTGHQGSVLGLAFSRDGSRIASASDDRTVRLWDVTEGNTIATVEGTGSMRAVAFSPDGTALAAGVSDGSVRRWSLESGLQLKFTGHEERVFGVAFSPSGDRLASVGADRVARIWNLDAGELARELRGHDAAVWAVDFLPDGRRLVTGGDDGVINVWDIETGDRLDTLLGHTGEVRSVAVSPDGRLLASASEDSNVRIWDVDTGQTLAVLDHHEGAVARVDFSSDGRLLVSGGTDGTIHLIDIDTGEEVLRRDVPSGAVYGVALAADGDVLVSAGQDQLIRVWNLEGEQAPVVLRGHTDAIWGIALSPDGKTLVSAGLDRSIRVWDIETLELVAALRLHTGLARGVAFSTDGARLASVSEDQSVQVIPTPTSEVLCPLLLRYLTKDMITERLPVGEAPKVCHPTD